MVLITTAQVEERVPKLADTFAASWGTQVLAERFWCGHKGYASTKDDSNSYYGRRAARLHQ